MTKLLFCVYFLVAFASHSAAGQLHDAVKDGNVAQVKLLIANGEDVNKSQKFLGAPLHQAAIRGSVEITELLLAAGADVDPENLIFGTPLHVAAQKGNDAVAIVLIGKGANVEARRQDCLVPAFDGSD